MPRKTWGTTTAGMLMMALAAAGGAVSAHPPLVRPEMSTPWAASAPIRSTKSHVTPSAQRREPSPPTSGNTIVTEALAVVARHTVMPLRGPDGLPGHPVSAPTWLTAAITSARTRYQVDLVWAPKPAPPPATRRVLAAQLPHPSRLIPAGSFGGTQYPSPTAARRALALDNAAFHRAVTGNPGGSRASARRPKRVTLFRGITAQAWHLGQAGDRLITWHQAGWTVDVTGRATVPQARALARAVKRSSLPVRHGLLVETVTARAASTALDWVAGRSHYWTRAAQAARALTWPTPWCHTVGSRPRCSVPGRSSPRLGL